MPQHNFLLIGLGGSGCQVVRELKKKLYIEWRSRGNTGPYNEIFEFDDKLGNETVISRVATLSIDSNKADLEGQGELTGKWRVLGETLRLTDREKLVIDPSGTGRILNSIDRYPGISPWIQNEMNFVRDITRGSVDAAGCNQIRRMGRLALACAGNIDNVMDRIADRLDRLSENGDIGANIHIACTLGAGTGSGTLIDVIIQIQRFLKNHNPKAYKIFIHAFATGKKQDADAGNFHANQYAALLELNALKFGFYKPWNIKSDGSQTPKRLSPPIPGEHTPDMNNTWNTVSLITETTEGGTSVSFDQQIDNAAELIFQLAVRQVGNVPNELRYAFTGEDRSKKYPADINGGNRSTDFISYGVQRAIIPEREIREKLTFSNARQSMLQLVYNNWDDRFRESPRSFSRDDFVSERQSLWRVTKGHLNLDVISSGDGRHNFEPYRIDWEKELKKQQGKTKDTLGDSYNDRIQWLTDFERRAANYWDKGFRSVGENGGVTYYFKNRSEADEIKTRARLLRDYIERDLIEGFEAKNPEYTLHHLPEAIELLLRKVEENLAGFSEEAPKIKSAYEDADRIRVEIRKEYRNVGRLSLPSKHNKLFDNYFESTCAFYYNRTLYHATEYAQLFCKKLIEQLKELHRAIFVFDRKMKVIVENFEIEFNERIAEEPENPGQDEVSYLIDAVKINDVIRTKFESNKPALERNTNEVIKAFQNARGDNFKFSSYLDTKGGDDDTISGSLVDSILKVSEEQVVLDHQKYCEDSDFEGILGQNIVQKLYNDYGGQVDGGLEHWLRELMKKAMPMISFDPNEEPMDLVGESSQGPVLRKCVFIPKCSTVPVEFTQRLERVVRSFVGGKFTEAIYREMPEDRKPNEITIISVAFFFPVRHTHLGHTLKEKYLNRLNLQSEKEKLRGYFELHTESHYPALPDLMKLGRKDALEEGLPVVLLAAACGLLPKLPADQGKQIFFGTLDNFERVKDKVESGMVMTAKLLSAAEECRSRFGQDIPGEVMALWDLYFEEFNEGSLLQLDELVARTMKERGSVEGVDQMLDDMAGQFFLLSGKEEEDPKYILFDDKAKKALLLAKTLADKSKL